MHSNQVLYSIDCLDSKHIAPDKDSTVQYHHSFRCNNYSNKIIYRDTFDVELKIKHVKLNHHYMLSISQNINIKQLFNFNINITK